MKSNIGKTFNTNYSHKLTLLSVGKSESKYVNQFGEIFNFNNRGEHISLLGSYLKIATRVHS